MKNVNTLSVQDADEIPYIINFVLRDDMDILFKFIPADTSERSKNVSSGIKGKYCYK